MKSDTLILLLIFRICPIVLDDIMDEIAKVQPQVAV